MTQSRVEIERPWGNGRIVWERDATANDSNKTFTVPVGKVRVLQHVTAQISTTATVGNRVLLAVFSDGTNRIFAGSASASIAASQTGRYDIGSGLAEGTTNMIRLDADTNANVSRQSKLPDCFILLAGYTIQVFDTAAIDAGADDMVVVLHYIEYDA